MKIKLLIILPFLVVGCSDRHTVDTVDFPIIGMSVENYVVLSINRPKHFSIDMKHASSGYVFERAGRSKHCLGWEHGPSAGDTICITTIYRKNPDSGFIYMEPSDDEINDLYCK